MPGLNRVGGPARLVFGAGRRSPEATHTERVTPAVSSNESGKNGAQSRMGFKTELLGGTNQEQSDARMQPAGRERQACCVKLDAHNNRVVTVMMSARVS